MSVFVNVVCCQVEMSARGRLLVRRNLTECGVSECDLGTATVRRPRHTTSVEPWEMGNSIHTGSSHKCFQMT
jgi:hypothetical protein